MGKPKVSVLLPVYNGEKYILEAVDSVINQTYQDFELIIVNDGSRDNTEKVLKPYLKNSKINYYRFDKNQGYPKACNKTVSLSKGEFLALQDADDVSLPRRLEEEVEVLEADEEVELVYGQVLVIDEEGKVYNQRGGIGMNLLRRLTKEEVFYRLYIEGNFIPNPTLMMRRRHITNQFYNPNFPTANDIEHNFRVTHDYKIWEISHPLVKLRRGQNHQSMSSNQRQMFDAERQIIKLIHQEYRSLKPKVNWFHYTRAISNRLIKEGKFYLQRRSLKQAVKLFFLALIYNPFQVTRIRNILTGKHQLFSSSDLQKW